MFKYTRPDEELIELLWQDGNVVMHKQIKHTSTATSEPDRDHPFRCERTFSKLNDSIPDEVTTPWFQHNLDAILETDLCTEFFYGVPNADDINAVEGEACVKLVPNKETSTYNCLLTEDNFYPTKSQDFSLVPNASVFMNSNCPASPMKIDTRSKIKQNNEKTAMNSNQKDVGQSSSTMTKMSSRCSSNHIAIQREQSQAPRNNASISREATNAPTPSTQTQRHVTTPIITSSSGGSGSTIGETIHHKRKQMETDDTEFQSEDGEDYSDEPSKQHQRSASTRRSRSAEVHNLSERKRRDRINEKLKALQDLIPHCTKTDKASVLDEAIEYLKSLQMQLQIMWMGSSMAQMMLPNLQHYFPSLSMGIAHGSVPPMPGSIQMPRVPMFNPHVSSVDAMNHAFPMMASVGNITQMPNVGNTDVYSRYLGLLHMQQTTKFDQSTDNAAHKRSTEAAQT